MSVCRTTCKASTRWIAKAANNLALCAAFALTACAPHAADAEQGCTRLRETFDKAFSDAVSASVRKAVDEKKKYLRASQDAYAAMERQGCCFKADVCPPLNVH